MGADIKKNDSVASAMKKLDSFMEGHCNDKANPHGVTPGLIGAAASSHTHTDVARADVAGRLENAKTIAVTGAVKGSTAFDGSGDASITTNVGSLLSLSYGSIHTTNVPTLGLTAQGTGYSIDINGSGMAFRPGGNGANGKFTLGNSSFKWGQIYSTNSTVSTSDREEKYDIAPIGTEAAIALVKALKPSTYKLKDGTSGRTHWGLVAQDIEQALEELGMESGDLAAFIKSRKTEDVPVERVDEVTGEAYTAHEEQEVEGYTYGLRYEEFIAPMLQVQKHLLAEVSRLKAEIEEMKQG